MGLGTRLAIAIVIACLSVTGPGFAAASDRTNRPVTIAAIGDSYLAGVGAGSYIVSDGCRRSRMSAPQIMARQMRARLVDLTCPGDTIASSSRRAAAIPVDTDLVIVQVGGNDMGFAALAGACFLAGTSTCLSTVRSGHHRLPMIREGLMSLVRQIRMTAPNSQVLVLGYPRLLGPAHRCSSLLDPQRVRAIDRLQRSLDRVIKSASTTVGGQFADWPRSVDRRSLCATDPWYALPGARLDDLLHPDSRATRALSRHLATVWS